MHKTNKVVLWLTPLVFLILTTGCTSGNRLLSGLRYKNNVISHEQDKRILFENDAKENAEKIRLVLDSCIEVVTGFYGSPFEKDIYITISATQKGHVRRCGDFEKSRGMANWGRVFISPLAFSSNTYTSILIHELTHLHTIEKIGIFHYIKTIPAWFSEGLSVYVSSGGGAESFTDSQAIDWILEGKHFDLTNKGSLLKPSGYVSTLPWPMFYKQSELFVKYLSVYDSTNFKILLRDLEQKKNFKKSFVTRYQTLPIEIFEMFLKEKRTARNSS